ncbi:MAG: protein kinase [Gemmatimonadales bacterium]|jgi:serine/threonine-protein kinase
MTSLLEKLRAALAPQYEVERELASGGMGSVFVGRDRVLHRQVAIKVLQPEIATDRTLERFLSESRTLARLKHPNIVPVFQAGEAEGISYYVMEYIEGETLADRLERVPLSKAEIRTLANDLLSALEAAHGQGIVHRDVKPANIFLVEQKAVLVDFGVAKQLEEPGEKLTATGYVVGTPAYMSPEQIEGDEITPATDVYAVGMVLYEAATGRRWSRRTPPAAADWAGVPVELEGPLRRALARSPADRWSDAAAFRRALSPGRRRRGKRFGPITAASILAVSIAAIAGLVIWQRTPQPASAPSPPRIAVLPFSVRSAGEFEYLGSGLVDLLSTKLDGAGDLRSADPRAILSLVARESDGRLDLEESERIAGTLGAGFYVLGNLVAVEGVIRLDARLYDRERGREAVAQASAEGEAARIFEIVDELAAQLLVGQSAAPRSGVTQIAAVTTGSLDALKAYLEGEREFRAGRFAPAAEAFRRATEIDSTFALAWYRLSIAGEWLLRGDLTREGAERAVRHSRRLPERVRRLLEATVAARRGDFAEAEASYRAILDTYTHDVETWYQLGELLFHFGPFFGRPVSESRQPFERVLSLEPTESHAFIHLLRIESRSPDAAALDSLASQFINLEPESDRRIEAQALRAFTIGDEQSQARVLAELELADDAALMGAAWSIPIFTENLTGGEKIAAILTQSTRPPEVRALGYAYLAFLRFAQGRRIDARAALDSGATIGPGPALEYRALLAVVPFSSSSSQETRAVRADLESWDAGSVQSSGNPIAFLSANDGAHSHLRLYLLALLIAQLNEDSLALEYARALGGLDGPDRVIALARDLVAGVRAQISLAMGDSSEALATLEKRRYQAWYQAMVSSPFHSLDRERYLRASLLAAAGREEEALTWYNSFTEGSVYALAYLAPSHLERAKIYERRGERERAAFHYRRFIEHWSHSDPELRARVREAEDALSRLADEE